MTSEDGFLLLNVDEFASYLASFTFTRPVRRVQNHHTWKPDYFDFEKKVDNHFSLLRAMRRFHMQERGWSDIGQNITTFKDGMVAVCRSLNTVPACIKGANTGSIGMEHLGNFDVGGNEMDVRHAAAIVRVNALLCHKLQLTPSTDTIVYHHWYDLRTGERKNGEGVTKSCPGTAFFGGNTVDAARTGFIPKVQEDLTLLQGVPAGPLAALWGGAVNADVLNVRDKPSRTGSVIRQLRKGQAVGVFASSAPYGSDAWLKTDAAREEWVAAKYITRT